MWAQITIWNDKQSLDESHRKQAAGSTPALSGTHQTIQSFFSCHNTCKCTNSEQLHLVTKETELILGSNGE